MSRESARIGRVYPLSGGLIWLIAIAVVFLVPLEVFVQQFRVGLASRRLTAPVPTLRESERVEDPGISALTLRAKYLVRVRNQVVAEGMRFAEPPDWAAMVGELEQMAQTRTERLRTAIVVGELLGVEEGIRRLESVRDEHSGSGALAADIEWLLMVFTQGAAGLPPDVATSLVNRHGWFAELAIARGADPRPIVPSGASGGGARIFQAGTRLALVDLALVGLGLLACGALFVLWRHGQLDSRIGGPCAYPEVYLETYGLFAISFIFCVGIGVMTLWTTGRLSAFGFFLGELLLWLTAWAVLWPRIRGIAWREVAGDLGLTRGEGLRVEVLCGLIGFLASVPIMWIVSLVVRSLVGVDAGEGADDAGFPMYRPAFGNSWVAFVAGALSAVVWAPFVEEIFYRGALYRSLRDRLTRYAAIPISAIAFGIVHPYGVDGLVSVSIAGIGFALLREWRGSLIAPIVAHMLHNGWLTLHEFVMIAAID